MQAFHVHGSPRKHGGPCVTPAVSDVPEEFFAILAPYGGSL